MPRAPDGSLQRQLGRRANHLPLGGAGPARPAVHGRYLEAGSSPAIEMGISSAPIEMVGRNQEARA